MQTNVTSETLKNCSIFFKMPFLQILSKLDLKHPLEKTNYICFNEGLPPLSNDNIPK